MQEELAAAEHMPVSEKAIHDRPAPAPSRRITLLGAIVGFALWGIGLATIGMILWAVLC